MPTFTFTSPEGKTYDVNAPEGGSRDQAFEVLQAQLSGKGGAQSTPATPMRQLEAIQPSAKPTQPQLGQPTQKPDDLMPYVGNKFRQGFAALPGVIAAAGDLATLPFRRGLEAITDSPKSEAMKNTAAYGRAAPKIFNFDPNMPVPKDQYGKPRLGADIAGHIAEFGGMSALPSAGAVAKSAKPLSTAAQEAVSIAASGEGATMGKHMAPEEHKDLGEFAGALTGPGLVNLAWKGVEGGANWVKRQAGERLGLTGLSEKARTKDSAQRAVGELAPQINTPTSLKNIEEAKAIGVKIPGFKENLTLGRMTDVPSVKTLEKHYGTTNPEIMDIARSRATGLDEAITKQTDRRFPSPPDVNAATGAKRAAEMKIAELDAGIIRIEEQQKRLAEGFQRGDIEQAGEQALKARERLANAAKASASERYKAVYDAAKAQGVKVNMTDIKDLASSINRESGSVFQDKPGVIGDILRRYEPSATGARTVTPPGGRGTMRIGGAPTPPEPIVSLEEFHSLYKKAGEDFATLSAAAKMGNTEAGQQARMVGKLHDQLKVKITEMEGPQYGEVGSLLKGANEFYRTKYADLFKRGVGGEMVAPGRFGPTASNENAKIFSSLVFKPRDSSGVKEYMAMVNGDKAGLQSLENGVMDIFSRQVVRNDKVDPGALQTFLRNYKEPLEAMPWVAKKIGSVEAATKSLVNNRQSVVDAQKQYAKSTLNKVYNSDNPDALVAVSMRSPKMLDTIVKSATTAEEKQAVSRAMMEHVSKQPDPIQFLTTNQKTLEQAMGKKHVGYLATILNAQKIAGRVPAPDYLAFEKMGDPLSKAIGTSIPSALSDIKSVTNRFASPEYAASRIGMRFWNKKNNETRDKILTDAIYNPEVAEALAKHLTAPTPQTQKAVDLHLFPYAARSAGAAYEYGRKQQ